MPTPPAFGLRADREDVGSARLERGHGVGANGLRHRAVEAEALDGSFFELRARAIEDLEERTEDQRLVRFTSRTQDARPLLIGCVNYEATSDARIAAALLDDRACG
jgi:hypothetical protein